MARDTGLMVVIRCRGAGERDWKSVVGRQCQGISLRHCKDLEWGRPQESMGVTQSETLSSMGYGAKGRQVL